MSLDSLIQSTGEWLRGTGPEADIVISTRIRLARNHASFPFTNRASQHQKSEIENLLRDRVAKLDLPSPLNYIHVAGLPMLDRQITRCGAPPRQVAADGGYASQNNLTAAKARGVTDVAFHKKRGLAVEDMVKSRWVYRKRRNFRAGIEAGIACSGRT